MINVTTETKNAYRADSSLKEITLSFPNLELEIGTDQLDLESMELVESISEDESIEFIGCNSSQFKVTIHGVEDNLKGEEIIASIQVGETESINLFHGIVDDVTISANKSHKTLKCYDILHSVANIDISKFYVTRSFPISIKNFRDQLFEYIGVTQVVTDLPNDDIEVEKQYSPESMNALDTIKAICQINGVFGIINRENKFEYRVIKKTQSATIDEAIPYQKSLKYQEYTVRPVDKLKIRQTEQDEGVTYGEGDNMYIIQGNLFTLNLDPEVVAEMAENIYPNVSGFYYMPFSSNNNGLPWLECGDYVSYQIYDYDNSTAGNPVYKTVTFYILSRTLSGIQNLRDEYEAKGDEFQRVFITDLQSRVETIAESVQEMSGRLQDFSLNYVYFTNEAEVVVSDGSEVNIAEVNFTVTKETQVVFLMEYLIDVETTQDGIDFDELHLTVKYYFDDVLINTRTPKETYVDGDHVLSLSYLLYLEEASQHDWRIALEAEGGSATIAIAQAQNVLYGQCLMQSAWNGRLSFTQPVEMTQIASRHPITFLPLTDGGATIATQTPVGDTLSDEIDMITVVTRGAIVIVGLDDELDVTLTNI